MKGAVRKGSGQVRRPDLTTARSKRQQLCRLTSGKPTRGNSQSVVRRPRRTARLELGGFAPHCELSVGQHVSQLAAGGDAKLGEEPIEV